LVVKKYFLCFLCLFVAKNFLPGVLEFRRQETVARIIPKQKRIYNREMSELFSF